MERRCACRLGVIRKAPKSGWAVWQINSNTGRACVDSDDVVEGIVFCVKARRPPDAEALHER